MIATLDALLPFLESTTLVNALDVDHDGIVGSANGAAAARLKVPRERLAGRPLAALVAEEDREAAAELVAGSRKAALLHFVAVDGVEFPLCVHSIPHDLGALLLGEPDIRPSLRLGDDLFAISNELAVHGRERSRRIRHLTEDLVTHERSHWHLQRDQEVLPICMRCSRVRTKDGEWEDLARYLRRSTDFLSHSYCDRCALAQ
jgi:PAS domain-containing protein